jgi:hypothetical protein
MEQESDIEMKMIPTSLRMKTNQMSKHLLETTGEKLTSFRWKTRQKNLMQHSLRRVEVEPTEQVYKYHRQWQTRPSKLGDLSLQQVFWTDWYNTQTNTDIGTQRTGRLSQEGT